MRKSIVVALLLAGLGLSGVRTASAADASPCVAVILDCSLSMEKDIPVATGTDVVAGLRRDAGNTRMDVAKDALKTQLDNLAGSGNYRVALWLFGHRLAWEGEGERPDLKEQTDYLEQSLGFNVLSELLPGDDVELARPMIKLEPESLQTVYMKLNVVKPWGEDPLYLSLVRALDNFGRQSAGGDRRIVVITDGANHQGLSKFATNKAQVIEALERRPVTIHIIRLGEDEISRQSEAELRQIATQSKGSYKKATSSDEFAKVLAAAFEEAAVTEPEATPMTTAVSTGGTPAQPAAPKFQNIEGTVKLYNRTVRGAKLILEAAGDQRQVFSDSDGNYLFKNVPAGDYNLRCVATVKNIIRDQTQPVRVQPVDKEPLNVPISLEEGSPYSGEAYYD